MKLAILGGGAWGTALARAFCKNHATVLWVKDKQQAEKIASSRVNERYLPDILLPSDLIITGDFEKATADTELVLIATPMDGFRQTLELLRGLHNKTPILWACKGFEKNSGQLPHQILLAVLPACTNFGLLCGPSFAQEVAKGLPTAITLAASDQKLASQLAQALSYDNLRIYAHTDLIGAQIGAAVKNIIAIASGVVEGMGLGLNARAALITRGLSEMGRLTVAMGGEKSTLFGLAGIGDLILTATGSLSRNWQFGFKLAKSPSAKEALASSTKTVEGIGTTFEIIKLAQKHQVDMPITKAVHRLLTDQVTPDNIVAELMHRQYKLEFEVLST